MAMPLHRCIPQWDLHIGDGSMRGYVLAVGASRHQGSLLSPKESHSGILLMAANSLYVHGGIDECTLPRRLQGFRYW